MKIIHLDEYANYGLSPEPDSIYVDPAGECGKVSDLLKVQEVTEIECNGREIWRIRGQIGAGKTVEGREPSYCIFYKMQSLCTLARKEEICKNIYCSSAN